MVSVVDGYLAFARGEGQASIETTDLGALLEDVAERSRNGTATIEVELEAPIVLPLRPTALRRCITNLIENAVRHAGRIAIRATSQRHHVWIAVDDDGPGIAEDQREAVFRAFQRIDGSRNPSTGGVGLGLTIARDIVLAHGGEIELHDSPLGGLRVLVRLPR
jgi:two-component system osmolarity sensor histidine kinase EnvZ